MPSGKKCDIPSDPGSQALIPDLEMKGGGKKTYKEKNKIRLLPSDPGLTCTHKYSNHGGLSM